MRWLIIFLAAAVITGVLFLFLSDPDQTALCSEALEKATTESVAKLKKFKGKPESPYCLLLPVENDEGGRARSLLAYRLQTTMGLKAVPVPPDWKIRISDNPKRFFEKWKKEKSAAAPPEAAIYLEAGVEEREDEEGEMIREYVVHCHLDILTTGESFDILGKTPTRRRKIPKKRLWAVAEKALDDGIVKLGIYRDELPAHSWVILPSSEDPDDRMRNYMFERLGALYADVKTCEPPELEWELVEGYEKTRKLYRKYRDLVLSSRTREPATFLDASVLLCESGKKRGCYSSSIELDFLRLEKGKHIALKHTADVQWKRPSGDRIIQILITALWTCLFITFISFEYGPGRSEIWRWFLPLFFWIVVFYLTFFIF